MGNIVLIVRYGLQENIELYKNMQNEYISMKYNILKI